MIYGRESEKAQLSELVAGSATGLGAVLVVRGEAGIGKSVLLDYAAGLDPGRRLLRVTGTEAEADLPFAGLHALLNPLRERIGSLPAAQSAALATAFGMGSAQAQDRFLVGLAVLTLLAEISEAGPVLCLIDDAQWLDRASAEALLFVARRLQAEPVAMVFGVRDGDRPFVAPDLPTLALRGLTADESAALLARRHADLSPAARDRLVAESDGNPLALIELSGMLSPEQRAGSLPPLGLYTEAPSPVGRVENVFRTRIGTLPDRTRTLLTLAAAEGTGDIGLVIGAAAAVGAGAADLEPAERAGLVEVTGDVLEFRHPLVKAAAYRGATLAERQRAHRALAAVLADGNPEDGDAAADRRAHHLTAAATGIDEELGVLLEQTADRAVRRGAPTVAASGYERAAQLTQDRELRARRLMRAAQMAAGAGLSVRAGELTERGLRLTHDPDTRARLAGVRAALEFERGNAAEAGRMVVESVESIIATDPVEAVAMLGAAAGYAWFAGDEQTLRRASRLLETARDDEPDPFGHVVTAVRRTQAFLSGDQVGGLRLLSTTVPGTESAASFDVMAATYAVFAGLRTGADPETYALAEEFAGKCRELGLIGQLTHALQLKVQAEIFLGRTAEARADGAEALRITEAVGFTHRAAHIQGVLALLAAMQGDRTECERLARTGIDGELAPGASWGRYALGLLELGHGDHRAAADRLAELMAGPVVGHTVIATFAVPSLVEARCRLGEVDRAGESFTRFADWAQSNGRPWALGVAARCRALLSAPDDAEQHYMSALEHHRQGTRPFEQARTQLLYGEWLRRARRRKEAADQLRAAADGFQRLGALPWLDRSNVELTAIGARPRAGEQPVSELDTLTPQERQVVQLAAGGASNREIAARLFLSPRTVGYHLYNAFPKLGVASRTELARYAT